MWTKELERLLGIVVIRLDKVITLLEQVVDRLEAVEKKVEK